MSTGAQSIVQAPQRLVRRSRLTSGPMRIVLPLLIAAAVLLVWEIWTRTGDVNPGILPSPHAIGQQMAERAHILLPEAWTTLKVMVEGYLLAVAAGLGLALLIVAFRPAELTLYPIVVGSQVIPKIAIAPIIFIWFGLGTPSRLIVVVLLAFFPILIASIAGLRSIEPNKIHLARSVGAGRVRTFVRFRIPNALPEIFVGLKLGATRAVSGAILAEFLTPGPGLGRSIYLSTSELRPDVAMAGIAYLVIMGLGFFFIVAGIERLAIPWHVSVRGHAPGRSG
jgi:NitT/TauT family transport system permease protein